jgi:hypothetical protein
MNGGKPRTAGASFAGRLSDPSDPWVPRTLAALGVRYAVIHRGLYFHGVFPRPAAGARLIGRRGGGLLYEVLAAPAPVVAVPGAGFDDPEAVPGGRFEQWLVGESGTIALVNSTSRPRAVALDARLDSFNGLRTVRVWSGDRLLLERRVDDLRAISFRVTAPPGTSELRLETDRPARSIAPGDPKRVSLRIGGVEVRTPGAAPIRVG